MTGTSTSAAEAVGALLMEEFPPAFFGIHISGIDLILMVLVGALTVLIFGATSRPPPRLSRPSDAKAGAVRAAERAGDP